MCEFPKASRKTGRFRRRFRAVQLTCHVTELGIWLRASHKKWMAQMAVQGGSAYIPIEHMCELPKASRQTGWFRRRFRTVPLTCHVSACAHPLRLLDEGDSSAYTPAYIASGQTRKILQALPTNFKMLPWPTSWNVQIRFLSSQMLEIGT